MEETVYLETTIKPNRAKVQMDVTTNSGSRWSVEELWYMNDLDLMQKLSMKKDDYVESYYPYYADLEVFPIPDEHHCTIQKSVRACRSKIEFKVYGDEYKYLKDYSGKFLSENVYGIKIVLSPVLKFTDAKQSQKLKRTKSYLIEGLKSLSQDIGSLLKDGKSFDVVLYCGGKTLQGHRNVLCARSSRFRQVFHRIGRDGDSDKFCSYYSTTLNAGVLTSSDPGLYVDGKRDYLGDARFVWNPRPNSGAYCELTLDDVEVSVVEDFLEFVYTGVYKICDLGKTLNLYLAACAYGIDDLRTKCVLSVKSRMTYGTVFGLLNFACDYGSEELQRLALDHLTAEQNFESLCLEHMQEWIATLRKRPYLKDMIMNHVS